jgi:hypothetical protein
MDSVVSQLETGDVIVTAEVVEGADKLIRPNNGGDGVGSAQAAAAVAAGGAP